MSQASLEISASLEPLPTPVQQALNMLDLEPERELERYRRFKEGKLEPLPANDRQSHNGEPSRPLIDTTDEEEEEEYELIPPSQPFGIREPEPQPEPSAPLRPGELVLSSLLQEDESLDLSLVAPGEIAQNPNEYLPASKELWRSLGQPEPTVTPFPEPKSRWRMPLAIGSTAIAIASVSGMTYVNTHPALLQKVPMVAQLTATPAPIQVPPGQSLQGPDLSMGEFTELTLANINGITLPGTAEPVVAAAAPTAPVSMAPTINPALAATPKAAPAPAVATAPASPAAANSPTLADSLIRNLLPANIQQLNARPAAAPQAETKAVDTKPYTPAPANKTPLQPQSAAASSYQVTTEYQSPAILAKIQALVPKATVSGNNKISLGTFKNKSEAEAVVKRLAQKGFVAQLK